MADVEPKARKGKPQPPNEEEHREILEQIEKRIADLKQQQQGVRAQIAAKSEGKAEYQSRKNDMQVKLREYEDIIQKHEADKTKCFNEIKANQNAAQANSKMIKQKRSQVIDGLRKPIGSLADIDREINEIERIMERTSLTLKEEKAKMEIIKKLKAAKPNFQQLESAAQSMGGAQDAVIGPLEEKRKQLTNLINEAREAKKQQKIQFERLKEQREKVTKDMPQLFEKADAIVKQLGNEHMQRRAVMEAYKRQQKEFNAHRAEERQAKYDKQRADRLERQADAEARRVKRTEDTEEEQPFLYETTLIEQTISFCKSRLPKEEVVVVEKESAAPVAEIDGKKILVSKKDREEDAGWSVGPAKSKKKMKKKDKNAPAQPSMDDKITHTAESLQIFANLKLKAPLKVSDLPDIIEKLNEQMEGFKEKIVVWKASEAERKAARAKQLAEDEKNLEMLRQQVKEAREASKAKEAEAAAKLAEEEDGKDE